MSEDSPKRKYFKRFLIRLVIVVALGIIFYLLKAWNTSQMPTPPPGLSLDNDITWQGWVILIGGALCILFIGLKHEPVDYSSSSPSLFDENNYQDVEPTIGEGYSDDSYSGSNDDDSNSTNDDQ